MQTNNINTFCCTGKLIFKYFKPSINNSYRIVGLLTAVTIPIANYFVPLLFINENNNLSPKEQLKSSLITTAVVNMLSGMQIALTQMLSISLMQAIRKDNVKLMTDENKFLLHADTEHITSLQYVTVGVGTRDLATHSILMFIILPVYLTSSAITCINIINTSDSLNKSAATLGFAGGTSLGIYFLSNLYTLYQTKNQKIENDLVAKVGFIEEHKNAISLIGSVEKIGDCLKEELNKIDSTISHLTLSTFLATFIMQASYTVGGQLLGGYYPSTDHQDIAINIMLMSLLLNMQNAVVIMTNSYGFLKLNLKQQEAFYQEYQRCKETRDKQKVIIKFKQVEQDGNILSLANFKVYKPFSEEQDTIFAHSKLELSTKKIYKLSAPSGSGKTTFLRAITDNWNHTEGTVILPINTKESMYFIPQYSFIPPGTLLEILTYPLTVQSFLKTDLILGIRFRQSNRNLEDSIQLRAEDRDNNSFDGSHSSIKLRSKSLPVQNLLSYIENDSLEPLIARNSTSTYQLKRDSTILDEFFEEYTQDPTNTSRLVKGKLLLNTISSRTDNALMLDSQYSIIERAKSDSLILENRQRESLAPPSILRHASSFPSTSKNDQTKASINHDAVLSASEAKRETTLDSSTSILSLAVQYSDNSPSISEDSQSVHSVENVLQKPLIILDKVQDIALNDLLEEIRYLIKSLELTSIEEDELISPGIDWNSRLSGGEKQKICIIRALLTNPAFLVMDEPTSALDEDNSKIVYSLIKDYITKLEDYVVIYTDHATEDWGFADAILTLKGEILDINTL